MVDREKVIKGLEICIRVQDNEKCPDECPYRKDICYGTVGLMADALSLLKAQEPKTVKEMLVVGGHLMGKCPRCCKILTVQDHPVACGFCGKAVKWDEPKKEG